MGKPEISSETLIAVFGNIDLHHRQPNLNDHPYHLSQKLENFREKYSSVWTTIWLSRSYSPGSCRRNWCQASCGGPPRHGGGPARDRRSMTLFAMIILQAAVVILATSMTFCAPPY